MLSHPFYEYSVNLNRMEIKGEYSYKKAVSTWTERAKYEEKRLVDKKNVPQIAPFSSINYIIAKLTA